MDRKVKDEWRRHFSPEVQRFAQFPERRREMEHGVMGDPFVASAEKGERLFTVLQERLVTLCREYTTTPSRRDTASSAAIVHEVRSRSVVMLNTRVFSHRNAGLDRAVAAA